MPKYRFLSRYRNHKVGGHSLRAALNVKLNGKALAPGSQIELKPGDIIECPQSLVEPFAWKFETLDGPAAVDTKPKKTLIIIKRPGAGPPWYDVIEPDTQKQINTKALKKEEAEDLAGYKLTGSQEDDGEGDPGTGQ